MAATVFFIFNKGSTDLKLSITLEVHVNFVILNEAFTAAYEK